MWRQLAIALIVGSTLAPPGAAMDGATPRQRRVNPVAATLKQFTDRVDAYEKLHKQVEAKVGPLQKTANPEAIAGRQQAIADAIRRARPDAKQGDLFTPPVADILRRFIARDLMSRDPVERRAFVVSQPDAVLHVNDAWPAGFPLATVPPRLLAQLPVLPDGLEYRFAGDALILRDVNANLVVDLLPGAIPARYRKK